MPEAPFTSRLSTARAIVESDAPLDPTIRAVLRALIDRVDRALAIAEDAHGNYACGGSASDAVDEMVGILRGGVADENGYIIEPDED